MNVNYLELEKRANGLKTQSSVSMDAALTANFSESASLFDLHQNLIKVDKFISIDEKKVEDAESFYHKIGKRLSTNLNYAESQIDIHTQGSAKNRTLIRSPSGELFDIDAICQITSEQVKSQTPLQFFDNIGSTLKGLGFEIEQKKRCWRIKNPNSGYYIDLTPAVPAGFIAGIQKFTYLEKYQDSAVYVVDCPQKTWKSSNPKGLAKWIEQQNEFSKYLVQAIAVCHDSLSEFSEGYVRASVEDVPEQNISHDDFLLLAIRLFKRHRDIKVRDNLIDKDSKPISVIISTLLGQCVEAVVTNKRRFSSLPALLQDIAFKLPHLVVYENGVPIIPNPTAPAENFADRWTEENGKRQKTFKRWTDLLIQDLGQLIKNNSKEKLDELFGTTQISINGNDSDSDGSSGLALGIVDRKPKTNSAKVPRDGLA